MGLELHMFTGSAVLTGFVTGLLLGLVIGRAWGRNAGRSRTPKDG